MELPLFVKGIISSFFNNPIGTVTNFTDIKIKQSINIPSSLSNFGKQEKYRNPKNNLPPVLKPQIILPDDIITLPNSLMDTQIIEIPSINNQKKE